MKRRVFNVVVDEQGQPISRALVQIQLNTATFVSSEQKEVAAWGIDVLTDANGRWEVELEANDTMSDPNSYYRVVEYSRKGTVVNEYLIRVPSTGFTEPIWIVDLLITPPQVTPPPNAVTSIATEGATPLRGDVRLLAGTGIQLLQDNNAKAITIVNTGGGGGGGAHNLLSDTHTDTQPTSVQQGMLIVGRLVAGIVKWAGLALGAAGKFLKSDGTDVVWGDVDWTDVKNRPSTFPPSPHTHDATDIISGRLSASRLPTSPNANRFLVVRTANADPTYDVIQASDLPSHTHTKSQITDLETITTTPTANAVPKADASGKIALGWIPQGSGSNLDADKLDGFDSTAFERVTNKGVANGYAPLDVNAKVPTAHLPSHTHQASEVDMPVTERTTSYTLQLTDKNSFIKMNSSTNVTVTIPTNASVPFPVGTKIAVMKYGNGNVTIQGATGVTLRDPNNQATITTRYDVRVIVKIGTDEWVVI